MGKIRRGGLCVRLVGWRPLAPSCPCIRQPRQDPRARGPRLMETVRRLGTIAQGSANHPAAPKRRPPMKTLNPLKVPFGKGKFSRLRNARYLQWENAFEVGFEDGLSFSNRTKPSARPTASPPPPSCAPWKSKMNSAPASSFTTTTARPPKSPGPSSANCPPKAAESANHALGQARQRARGVLKFGGFDAHFLHEREEHVGEGRVAVGVVRKVLTVFEAELGAAGDEGGEVLG